MVGGVHQHPASLARSSVGTTANMSIEKGVAIVGGGPAGLYLSILLKQARPELAVSVHERNTPQDAYGFGVVFSDETLDNFEVADPISYRAMTEEFRHWGEIKTHHPEGAEVISGGHGFAAISRRALLETLTSRARRLDVELRFSTEVKSLSDIESVGVIVGADGANSIVRRELESHLRPSLEHARNKYIWFGTTKGVRRVQLHLRRHALGDGVGPHLPVQRRGQHLHRGDASGDLVGSRLRQDRR